MTLVRQIKGTLVRVLDKLAGQFGAALLRTYDKWTHRHEPLSALLTSRYGAMFERLQIEEIDFQDASSRSLSFWCGDSLVTTKLSEAFEYGQVIRRLVGGDGRVHAYVGEFHDTVSVDTVESEVRSILEQAEIALLEGRVDFSVGGYSNSSTRARQTWAELERSAQ